VRRPGAFVAAYVLAFTAFSAGRGDRRVVAYLVVLGGLAAVFRRLHRRFQFPTGIVWALSLCGLLHLWGGLIPASNGDAPIFYETWIIEPLVKYDQLTHFTATAVLTAAAWHVLGRLVDPRRCSPATRAVLATTMAVGLGAVNEVFEFLAALRLADVFVGGLTNVGWDLVFNLFGAASAAVWLALAPSHSPARELVR
jgi:uncharacterized membrane protein YjdF